MKPERPNIIEQLFQSALDLAPEQRSGFLDERCAGDLDLRREVESLLSAHSQAGSFIEDSASDVAAAVLEKDSQRPSQIGQYQIERLLGAGGMGEVYLATDSRLKRKVALKLLPAWLLSNREHLQRFEREAQAASALNHPNICTIYEISDHDGTPFIAMEHVEGATLAAKLGATLASDPRPHRLDLAETLDIALQLADALGEAHARGIVHRDIKPANIIVNQRGQVKVLDFGLAKRVMSESEAETQQFLSHAGIILGTAAYMSPEQARGLPVDARTDVWSFGVVLYEMLAGAKPFDEATTTDLLAAILRSEPEALHKLNYEVPDELERIVLKALRKDRGDRYASAKDLFSDLKELRNNLDFGAPSDSGGVQISPASTLPEETQPSETRTHKGQTRQASRYLLGGVLGLLLVVVGLVYWAYANRHPQIESIAVLPFVNESGNSEVEYLSDGMTESLINSLSHLPNLSVKARSSVFRYKGKQVEPQTIASELSVQAILTGRMVQRGDDLTLYLSLVGGSNGNQLWGEQYQRKLTDLVSLQNEIARDVSQKLKARLSGEDEQKLAKNYTNNVEAYQLYLKGRYHYYKLTQPEIRKGIALYQQAIEADPTYALAYAGMADAYRTLPFAGYVPSKEAFPQAKSAARRALEIDENLAEAHIVLGWVGFSFDWDWTAAESEFKKAIELSPNNPDAHRGYGHLFSLLGRHDEAIAEIKRARELDPLTLITNALEGQFLFYAGRNDEAIARLKQTLEIDPNFWIAHNNLGRVYIRQGRYDEAIAELNRAKELSGGSTETIAQLGYALAKSGKSEQAKATLAELRSFAAEHYVPAYGFAMIHNGLGEKDEALKYLEESLQQREVNIIFIKIDTRWDDLRAEPRFQALLQGVGFKP